MYHITDTSRISQFKKVLDNKAKNEGIAILYDDDTDGLTSGVLIVKMLERLGFDNVRAFPKVREQPLFSKAFISELSDQHVTLVIAVDFEPKSWKFIDEKRLNKMDMDLVIIDHHYDMTQLYDSLTAKRERIYIHPLNSSDTKDAGQYCCSKFIYDICSQFCDISDQEWKVVVGMIGDMNVIDWGDFVHQKAADFGYPIGDKKEDYFTSIWGRISGIVYFANSRDASHLQEVFTAYVNAEKPEHMIKLESKYEEEKQFYEKVLLEWRTMSTFDEEKEMYVVSVPPKGRITSMVSSIVSYINSESTFIFFQDNDEGMYHLSGRSQESKCHLGKLFEYATKGFKNAHGGGHKHAAGGICQAEDFNTILQRIKDNFDLFIEE